MPRYRQPLAHSLPWQLANHALVFPQEQLTEVRHFLQQLSLLLSSLVATSLSSAAASRSHVFTSTVLDISHFTVLVCYNCRRIHDLSAQIDMAAYTPAALNARTCVLQIHYLSQRIVESRWNCTILHDTVSLAFAKHQ